MIRIQEAENRDQSRWDAYVLSHPACGPYHLFAWKRAVEEAYSHTGIYLIAEDGQGDIQGVFPLVLMKPPFLKPVLVSLPFCDYGGVLSGSPQAAEALISRAAALASEHRAELDIRCRQAVDFLQDSPLFVVNNHKVRMVLDLPESSQALWGSFKSKLRSQIRKPGKEGLEFRLGSSEFIDPFYSVFRRTMKDLGSPVHARKWFEAVLGAFGPQARIGIVYRQDRPIAAGCALECRETISMPWATTLRQYNHLSPNMLLYWGFLEHACSGGFGCFDFGRSTPDEGTYRFKEQWGARPELLYWYAQQGKNQTQNHSRNGNVRKFAEQAWSRLPQTLADRLGPMVRRYISL
jgi:FemAB-related protein (PEP-CTERM system-associated)